MTYIVSVGPLTFLFGEDSYPQVINFAEIAAMTNENKINPDTKVN